MLDDKITGALDDGAIAGRVIDDIISVEELVMTTTTEDSTLVMAKLENSSETNDVESIAISSVSDGET